MIARRSIEAKGVQAPETAIPAREFLQEMDRRGIRISGASWR